MSNWFTYIALNDKEFITGICNDLVEEEKLLNDELNTKNSLIQWYELYDSKIKALKKLRDINELSDEEKIKLIMSFNKIIILKDEDYKESFDKYPLVYNLKQTLQLSNFLKEIPELWKLDDLYIENVSEYLSVKRNNVEFIKLWNISVDFSANVGLVTHTKFFPIIKY